MEGQFVADSPPCVYSDCELGLSVGAIVKQRPGRQLPVIQHGRQPEICEQGRTQCERW